MGSDVLQALNEVGFEKYTQKLKEFMENYNQDKEDKRSHAAGANNGDNTNAAGLKRGIDMVNQ